MFIKINKISSLRLLKISFHLCNFAVISFIVSIIAMLFTKPMLAINGTSIRVSQLVSQVISDNKIVLDSWSGLIIILYTFTIVFLIASSIIFYFIRFNNDFLFNNKKQNKLSLILIITFWLYFIFLTAMLFTNTDKAIIDTKINQAEYTSITNFLQFTILNGVAKFEYSNLGISFVVISSLVLTLVFVSWIIFSFKIINKKYI